MGQSNSLKDPDLVSWADIGGYSFGDVRVLIDLTALFLLTMASDENRGSELLRTLTEAFRTLERSGAQAVMASIGLLRAHLEAADKKALELEAKYRALVERVAELERKLTARRLNGGLVEYHGARFEPDGRGGFRNQPLCPLCHKAMRSDRGGRELDRCTRCDVEAWFSGDDLAEVMSEVLAEHASASKSP